MYSSSECWKLCLQRKFTVWLLLALCILILFIAVKYFFQGEGNKERIHNYLGADVFVVCFSVVKPDTFFQVQRRWLPEIQQHAGDKPFLIVGTQADLRDDPEVISDLRAKGQRPISFREAMSLARRVGSACYVECSPVMKKRLRRVMNDAFVSVFSPRDDHFGLHCAILWNISRTSQKRLFWLVHDQLDLQVCRFLALYGIRTNRISNRIPTCHLILLVQETILMDEQEKKWNGRKNIKQREIVITVTGNIKTTYNTSNMGKNYITIPLADRGDIL